MIGFGRRWAAPIVGPDADDDYADALAAWQITNGTDGKDLTPAMRERRRLCNQLVNAGLDPARLIFVRRLVERGQCSDDKR